MKLMLGFKETFNSNLNFPVTLDHNVHPCLMEFEHLFVLQSLISIQYSITIPPENIRKALVFGYFQGVHK